MDPIFFVFAWLAYVALLWLGLLVLEMDQDAAPRRWLNASSRFLTGSLRERL
jgi:hypothetical protein